MRIVVFGCLGIFALMACTPASPDKGGGAGGSSSGSGGGIGQGGGTIPPCVDGICEDFPADPIFDGNAPPNAPDLFGDPSNNSGSGGPCLFEPQVGTLFPNNWLRPRFRHEPPVGHDLFEIRLSAEHEKNDLVVYTTNLSWTMPAAMWTGLAAHIQDEPIDMMVRSLNMASPAVPALGSNGPMTIAPAAAMGSMVFWATIGEAPPDAWLEGFSVGEESTLVALALDQVQQAGRKDQGGNPKPNGGAVTCIGCHTSTPDGEAVAFTDHWPWSNVLASVEEGTAGAVPSYLSNGAAEALNQPWLGVQAFSGAHWQAGDRIAITSYGRANGQIWDGQTWSDTPAARLAWFDLETPVPAGPVSGTELAATEGTSYGFIARTGDVRGAMVPDWSHDGSTIVYVSTNAGKDGRLAIGEADLYTVPYNDKAGGAATPVQGASAAEWCEYYPEFSPDDQLIAFNRAPVAENMYYNPNSEVFVVPAAGGTPVRLAANDPPACASGIASPGITNSWPKWAPDAPTNGSKKYYWLIFSSARDGYTIKNVPSKKASQLYITAVVVDNGTVTSFPALYLWNQKADTSNHTPAWDVFKIPPVK